MYKIVSGSSGRRYEAAAQYWQASLLLECHDPSSQNALEKYKAQTRYLKSSEQNTTWNRPNPKIKESPNLQTKKHFPLHLMLASLKFKNFVEEILIPLKSVQRSTPPTTKLRTRQMVPLCMVRPAEGSTIPIMGRPPPQALGTVFGFPFLPFKILHRWFYVGFLGTRKNYHQNKRTVLIKHFSRKLETSKATQSFQRPSHHAQDFFPFRLICILGVSNREP